MTISNMQPTWEVYERQSGNKSVWVLEINGDDNGLVINEPGIQDLNLLLGAGMVWIVRDSWRPAVNDGCIYLCGPSEEKLQCVGSRLAFKWNWNEIDSSEPSFTEDELVIVCN